mgnify:CR=1 FL=1|jgi:hypothetical protein
MSLPYTGLTFEIVAKELGEKSLKLSDLCTSKNINLFAWRKPFAYAATKVEMDDYQAWRGRAYGFQLAPQIERPISGQELAEMSYNPPSGGTEQPFRLGDFRGYDHTAKSPITLSITTEYDDIRPTVCKLTFNQLDGQLTLSEIFNTQSLYLTFIYVNSNRIRVISAAKAIKDLDRAEQVLEIPSSSGDTGIQTDLYVCMTLKQFVDYQDLNEWSSLGGCFPLNFPNYHNYHSSFVVQAPSFEAIKFIDVTMRYVHHNYAGAIWLNNPVVTFAKENTNQSSVTFNAADYYLEYELPGHQFIGIDGKSQNQLIVNDLEGTYTTKYSEETIEFDKKIYIKFDQYAYDKNTNLLIDNVRCRIYRKKDYKLMYTGYTDFNNLEKSRLS